MPSRDEGGGEGGTDSSKKKPREPIKVRDIKLIIVSAIAVLVIANVIIYLNTAITYSITSNGLSTFSISDPKISFLIDNNLQSPTKYMSVWLNPKDIIKISTSNLIEENSGRKIEAKDVLFNNTPTLLLSNKTQQTPNYIVIDIKNNNNNNQPINESQAGVYHGHFFIDFIEENGKYSIPITVDVNPTFDKIIIWVINGIAISIAFWKIIKFTNGRNEIKDHKTQSTRQDLFSSEQKEKTLYEYVKDKQITHGTILKNAVLDVSSIIFGIIIGMLALLNNDFITGIHFLDLRSIIVLIGIGLGIGSLKEYVFQASEPNK